MMETDHRIANSLQFLAAMLRHESHQLSTIASARAALNNAAGRLGAIARMHRQLTRSLPDGEVDLGRFLDPFRTDVLESVGAILHVRSEDVRMRAEEACQICIILNELAMNAVKHGHHDGKPVILTVETAQMSGKRLRLKISDNGPGLPKNFDLDRADGLGMVIVSSTVEKLGGTFQRIDGSGAAFEILLPPR